MVPITLFCSKALFIMRWSVDTDPLVVLHAKPLLMEKKVSNLAAPP